MAGRLGGAEEPTMAGHVKGVFQEKVSPFLQRKYVEALRQPAQAGDLVSVIARQYLLDDQETHTVPGERRRHYEAALGVSHDGRALPGLERLYRRSIVLVLTTVCAAHCRWCLRGLYDQQHLNDEEIRAAATYCGSAREAEEIREVVITGGDPLMVVDRLATTLRLFGDLAPAVTTFRIGTRVPLQDPERIDSLLISLLSDYRARIEIALHVNHASELFPEVRGAIRRLQATGATIYNQGVLLKGVNDSCDALVRLAESLRQLRIEPHYLFHCAPIRGMGHHRTSVSRGLELWRAVFNSGLVSGRARPAYALLTDVGKVTLYEGTILAREENRILVQTDHLYADRLRFNPGWRLPASASIGPNGCLRVWYEDGHDDPVA